MPRIPSPPRGLTAEEPFPPDCARRFSAIEKLGEGGFGAVYRALDRNLGCDVAVKLLFASLLEETDQVARFTDEARITASVVDPHVVRVIDFGAEYGVPWIAFELVPGRSARALIEASAGRGLPIAQAVAACADAARALEAAHARGVLHRDVKPDNLLEAAPGRFKLTDFGIASTSGARAVKTATGVILGTPAYVAPELVLGQAPSPATDQYALGVTLFELVTGEAPFRGETIGEVLEAHLRAPVPSAAARRAEPPAAVDALIARALAKDPDARFASAGALADALERLRASEEPADGAAPRVEAASANHASTARIARPGRPSSRTVALAAPDAPRRTGWALCAGLFALFVLAGAWRVRTPAPPASPAASAVASPRAAGTRVSTALLAMELELGRALSDASALTKDVPLFATLEDPGVRAEALDWSVRVARRVTGVAELIERALREHGREPELTLLVYGLREIAGNVNRAEQELSPGIMYTNTWNEPHAVAAAMARWQQALAVPGAGDYAYVVRTALDPLVTKLARSRWKKFEFHTDTDVLEALLAADRALAQVSRRAGRAESLVELMGRLSLHERALDTFKEIKGPARELCHTARELTQALARAERDLDADERGRYVQWLQSSTGRAVLRCQLIAAIDLALAESGPARFQAIAEVCAAADGRGLAPEFTISEAGDGQLRVLSAQLEIAVEKLALPAALAPRWERTRRMAAAARDYVSIALAVDSDGGRNASSAERAHVLMLIDACIQNTEAFPELESARGAAAQLRTWRARFR